MMLSIVRAKAHLLLLASLAMASPSSMPSIIVQADTKRIISNSLGLRTMAKFGVGTTSAASSSLDSASMAKAHVFSPSANSTLDAFTLFPKLPMEVQLMIWKMSLPGPRVIKVKVFAANSLYDPNHTRELESSGNFPRASQYYFWQRPEQKLFEMEKAIRSLVLSANVKSPGSLFACHNSRSEAMKKYTSYFQLHGGRETRFDPIGNMVLISHIANFALPPLPYMVGDAIQCPDYGSQFLGVQNLAINNFDLMAAGRQDMKALLSQFCSLKNLMLLVNNPRHQETPSFVQSDDDVLALPLMQAYPQMAQEVLRELLRDLEGFKGD